METFESSDGTVIAFERAGTGPPVVLVEGALRDRTASVELSSMLAATFAVYTYDRRGRGASGDSPPYSVDLEVEDLEALIMRAGGSAAVFGRGSGAALALLAAADGVAIGQLVAYEPPYVVDSGRARPSTDLPARVRGMVAAGRPADAVERYLVEAEGRSTAAVARMQAEPGWSAMEGLAPTITHDLAIMGDYAIPEERFAAIKARTSIVDGIASAPWLREAAQATAAFIPGARYLTLEGPSADLAAHDLDARTAAPVLAELLS